MQLLPYRLPTRASLRRPCLREGKPPTFTATEGASASTPCRQLVMADGHCFINIALSLRARRNSLLHCASTSAPAERRSAKKSDHNGVLHRDSPAGPKRF